jgi:peptidoglycan-associated lipoprotein
VEPVPEEPIFEAELEPGQPSPREMEFEPAAQLQDVYFEFDKSDLTESARQILKQNADWINGSPGVRIQIEGHTDERGTEEYNLALGERRARTVKNYLISLGVDPGRLYTISYGEELPVNPEHNEAAWSQNRRAHFLVTQ